MVSEQRANPGAWKPGPDTANTITEKCFGKILDRLKAMFPCTFQSGRRPSRKIGLLEKLRLLSLIVTHRDPQLRCLIALGFVIVSLVPGSEPQEDSQSF